ncbi:MAG TPA: pyridoxal phosphate-dependent aminotransferase [Streptosporangiaceae bacterium]|jgi:aspartate aminotransferase|nr:pyridoxal phosphate-dependent aminotransferase [Streptosporangiaceae bacterium]
MSERKLRGEPVLPLAFGEAGLPAHPALRLALAEATGRTGYGPVAGQATLREAAAGYWERRGLRTRPDAVVCGPGSKALLFGLMLAIGADVAVPRPSWVSYAAQASLIGAQPYFVDTPPGQGGVPDPDKLARAVTEARSDGRDIRSVIVTLPDNPTGTLATPRTIRALCEVAEEHGLIIISDEIYRDLVYDAGTPLVSPAAIAPDRTIVTTALSKSLALGGWRIGVARLPDSEQARPLRRRLRDRLLGICSEIWSAPAAPIQQAAAFAFSDPPELAERIALSRRLHATVARAVADRFTAAGADVPRPQAAFYLYPDFGPVRDLLGRRHGVTTSAELAALLLQRYGVGVLPGSAFGEDPAVLRLRVATGLLYGETSRQREAALTSAAPLDVPWIAASLAQVEEVLTDLTG